MARMIPMLMRSEKQVRVIAGILLLLFVPPFLALTVIAGKFTDVRDPMAADRAQVARRISEGKGFTTDNIRPLSRSIYKETDLTSHPDLYNAPAYPALLGGVFWILDLFGAPPMDVTVAGFGAALWVLAVWLTYLVARKWFGGGVGMLAALFYGCSAGVLMLSVEGSVAPLLTIFVLAAMWAANVGFRRKVGRLEGGDGGEAVAEEMGEGGTTIEVSDEREESVELGAARLVLAGLACGAAILTHYVMMVFAVAFGIYLLAGQKRKARVVGLFGLGLLVMLVPWMARNFQVAGAAWTSLWWYDSMTRTGTYPGDSVYLMSSTPQGPFGYFITHPPRMLVKLLGSMAQYRTMALRVVEPLLAILFLVALFNRGAGLNWRRTVIFSVVAWVVCILASGLFRVDAAFLVAWLPLAAVACAVFVKGWIEQTVGEFSYAGLRRLFTGREVTESEQKRWRILWRVHLGQKASRFIVYALVAGVAFVPVLVALQGRARGGDLISGKDIAELKDFVKEEEVVLTDQPALVAWHAQRTAVGMFQKEDALLEFARVCGEPAAIYITLAALTTMREEMGDWWKWVGTAQGMYRNWAPTDPMPSRALLRMRSPELRAQREREVAPWLAAVNREPRASEPRVQLGQEYFARELLQDAYNEYVAALERDGFNLDAVRGLEQLSARLNDNVNALALAQLALTMSAEDPRGRAIIVEARLVFKKAHALQPRNVWLLMQLAACEAKLKNWDEAEKYLTRAGQASGNRVPPQLLVGLLHMNRGKFEEAEKEFRDLTLKHDSNQFAHLALGEALMAQGKYRDAVASFENAQKRRSGFRAFALAATAQVHLKQYEAAEKNFEEALRLSPNMLDLRHPYAELLEMTGKFDRAIEIHEGTLVIAPDDALAMIKLANLLAQSGKDLKRALALAQQAAAKFPTSDVVQGTLGWVHHLSGDNEKAILHLREAVRLSPSVAAYHINLGKALLSAGQKSEGRDALRAALSRQLSPETKAEIERLLATP